MRFTDDMLVSILDVMRTPGGKRLSANQWQAMLDTESSAEQPVDMSGWYHVCYCWSIITMASFMVARQSAREAGQTLFYMQAIDQPVSVLQHAHRSDFFEELLRIPSINTTKRLPGVVFGHYGMRMRFTTTLQQPFAVQDVECVWVGFDPDDQDRDTQREVDASEGVGEYVCEFMPKAIYVKIDDCNYNFLPPAPCCVHKFSGYDETCPDCRSAAQPGVFAVKPLTRTFRYYYDPKDSSKYINVQRKQFPLMPAPAVPLYSMQGTTADPGMVAYWFFPQRCSETIKWLIVYVMLSRPRSLAGLRSVGLTTKIKEIIEQGPPEDLVANFKKLFETKMRDTKALAMRLAKDYDLLPGRV